MPHVAGKPTQLALLPLLPKVLDGERQSTQQTEKAGYSLESLQARLFGTRGGLASIGMWFISAKDCFGRTPEKQAAALQTPSSTSSPSNWKHSNERRDTYTRAAQQLPSHHHLPAAAAKRWPPLFEPSLTRLVLESCKTFLFTPRPPALPSHGPSGRGTAWAAG
jgi:hypothetical protein